MGLGAGGRAGLAEAVAATPRAVVAAVATGSDFCASSTLSDDFWARHAWESVTDAAGARGHASQRGRCGRQARLRRRPTTTTTQRRPRPAAPPGASHGRRQTTCRLGFGSENKTRVVDRKKTTPLFTLFTLSPLSASAPSLPPQHPPPWYAQTRGLSGPPCGHEPLAQPFARRRHPPPARPTLAIGRRAAAAPPPPTPRLPPSRRPIRPRWRRARLRGVVWRWSVGARVAWRGSPTADGRGRARSALGVRFCAGAAPLAPPDPRSSHRQCIRLD